MDLLHSSGQPWLWTTYYDGFQGRYAGVHSYRLLWQYHFCHWCPWVVKDFHRSLPAQTEKQQYMEMVFALSVGTDR